ncbi:MAG TPA: DUF4411 family protein [Stellaceae bacterium]|jgi:Domain of unknown function (DUF4411)|nr:DUF4411 family protein [Stellaceae bacterium]
MPKYCVDTSGLSHPYEEIPEDIHSSLWQRVRDTITAGHVAVTQEIFDEITLIPGGLGTHINKNKGLVLYEVQKGNWNWQDYIKHATRMQSDHKAYIREFCGGSPKTVCLNDISIIALAKTLKLPVLSMEKKVEKNSKKRHIPDICNAESVTHIDFNDFCRQEGFQF